MKVQTRHSSPLSRGVWVNTLRATRSQSISMTAPRQQPSCVQSLPFLCRASSARTAAGSGQHANASKQVQLVGTGLLSCRIAGHRANSSSDPGHLNSICSQGRSTGAKPHVSLGGQNESGIIFSSPIYRIPTAVVGHQIMLKTHEVSGLLTLRPFTGESAPLSGPQASFILHKNHQ